MIWLVIMASIIGLIYMGIKYGIFIFIGELICDVLDDLID